MKIIDRGFIFDAAGAPELRRTNSCTSLLVLPDDTLVAAFRYGRTKDDIHENISIRRSAGGGHSWETVFEEFPHVVDGVYGAYRYAGISQPTPGKIMAAACWFDRSDHARPLSSPDSQGTLPCRLWLLESSDGGRTWTDSREVDTRPQSGIASTGAAIRLHTGGLAVPYEAWQDYKDTGRGFHHAMLRLSSDEGYTYEPGIVVAHDPTGRVFYWDQRIAIDPKTGELVSMLWTHDRETKLDKNVHIAWGTPDGRTWSAPHDCGFAGQIANPLFLHDGRLIAVYVHRHAPPTLRLIVSHDRGRTWDKANELIFYESKSGAESGMQGPRNFADYWSDMYTWSFGHPEARLLSNGDIFIAYYGGIPTALSMHWTRVEL